MAVPWRERLAEFIAVEAKPQEKFGHQPRLYALTREIGEGLAYDDDVVCAAAWLHDLGVFVGHRPENPVELVKWDHVLYTVQRVPGILTEFGFSAEKIPAVLECIRNHQPHDVPTTIEATILRDADMLEQLGAIGIARTVCKIGRDTRFATFTQAAASLERSLEVLPGMFMLPKARILAESRMRVHREFLDALAAEAGELLL